jgi:hypothetical protein
VPGDNGFGPPARGWSLDRRPDVSAKAPEIELEFTGVEKADRIADGAGGCETPERETVHISGDYESGHGILIFTAELAVLNHTIGTSWSLSG